jgi:hypothetical protein
VTSRINDSAWTILGIATRGTRYRALPGRLADHTNQRWRNANGSAQESPRGSRSDLASTLLPSVEGWSAGRVLPAPPQLAVRQTSPANHRCLTVCERYKPEGAPGLRSLQAAFKFFTLADRLGSTWRGLADIDDLRGLFRRWFVGRPPRFTTSLREWPRLVSILVHIGLGHKVS